VAKIVSTKMGGGASVSAARPPAAAAAAASRATPSAVAATSGIQGASQPINFHLNIQTLDTASITPDTMQTMVDGFAPAIADAFGRGVHQAPLGA